MMRLICMVVFGVMAALATGGCAIGPSYTEFAAKTPPLANNLGRIYFYRDGSPLGAAIQPHVSLNEETVGKSVPGGFFYVDRPAGNYTVQCVTEAKQTLALTLSAGETRYVRTVISMGMAIGHITPYLEDETTAMKTLKDCHYTSE